MSLSASKEQQRKVKDLPCIICGVDGFETKIDAAHVYPRRFAHCDCADGVVPLCRDHHRAFDDRLGSERLDLLPYLLNGWRTELLHAALVHDASPLHLLEVVTGTAWQPASESRAA